MTADLTRAQLDLLAACRALGHFPESPNRDLAVRLQTLDLVDDYGAVTSLGALLLALRWQARRDIAARRRGLGVALLITVALLLVAVGFYGLAVAW